MLFLLVSFIFFVAFNFYFFLMKKSSGTQFFVSIALSFGIMRITTFEWKFQNSLIELVINFLKNLILILLEIGELFTLNLDYPQIILDFQSFEYKLIAQLWLAFLYLMATIVTFGLIIQLLGDWFSILRLKFSLMEENHIFFGVDSSVHNFIEELSVREKTRIVFINCNRDDFIDLPSKSLFININESSIFKLLAKLKSRNFYYFVNNQVEDFKIAIQIIKDYGNRPTDDCLYVTDSNNIIQDFISYQHHSQNSVRGDDILKIRSLNNERIAIYNYFFKNKEVISKLFEEKPFFVIVGNNNLAIESIKLLAWLSQVFGKELRISVIFSDEDFSKKIKYEMPGLFSKFTYEKSVHIEFVNISNLSHPNVYNVIKDFNEPSSIFLLTDDVNNIKLVSMVLERMNSNFPFVMTLESPVFIELYTPIFKDSIVIVNSIANQFQNELENIALKLHTKYQNTFIESNFYNNNYNYYSTMARALGNFYSPNKMYQDEEKVIINWKSLEFEHNRWSVYLKTEGWTFGEKRDNLRKKHPLLLPFEMLPMEEQLKDLNY